MSTVRDIMTPNPACLRETDTVVTAAQAMRDLDVGSLPICSEDKQVLGMVTDRDIVVGCVAGGRDVTATTAREISSGTVYSVGPDESVDAALQVMQQQQVRRLPIIEDGRLVGIVSQADIALSQSAEETGETVEQISQ